MPTATHGSASVLIAASADEVYRRVTDVTTIGERSPECYAAKWLDGATEAVKGARFKGYNKLGPIRWSTVCIVTEADAPHAFGFVVVSGKGREETRWRYLIEPAGDTNDTGDTGNTGNTVRLTESYEFLWCPAAARVLELPFPRDRQLRRGLQTTLQRVKSAVEQHAGLTAS